MRAFLFNQKMSFLLHSIHFFFLVSSFLNTFVSPIQHLCHPDQRDALLEFKSDFEIQKPTWDFSFEKVSSHPKTESWVNKSDCCSWDGITCDAQSGKVIGLDLSASCLHGRLESNSSLFRLQHLRDLNLAYNNFTASPIPAQFDKLKGLERLNLSMSSFSGQIPNNLLQLTKLVSLDLSPFPTKLIGFSYIFFEYHQNSLMSIDESFLPLLARNLRSLRDLDMSFINISLEIPHEFSNMWSLRSLYLGGCNLFGEFPSSVLSIPNLQSITLNENQNLRGYLPDFRVNNSLLELNLRNTSFSGIIPDSISRLKFLTSLTLAFSNFFGRIPSSVGNLSSLSTLSLSRNSFLGEIPSSVGNLKKLTYFGVLGNKLSGNFPSALLNLTQLSLIDIAFNQFTGFLPPNISELSNLEYFFASENSFTGAIPLSLFKISSLFQISLEDNQLNDTLGIENISLLPDLHYLSLSNNFFRVSPIDLNFFSPLKHLALLDLSGIPLSTKNINSDSEFSSHLEDLYLSGCSITEFPKFIRNQQNMFSLDLSNNKIKGQVPNWLWRLPELTSVYLSNNSLSGFEGSLNASHGSQLYYILDLRSNMFQGPLFFPSRSIVSFWGSKNNFSGEIPRSICGLSSAFVIDLSNNNLHGSIPRCLVANMSSLYDLNLHKNRLKGSIPNMFMKANNLRSLDVGHNQLVGKLPRSLTGCSSLEVLNVGNNQINDTFPFWLNSLQNLQVLVLSSNEFHGPLYQPQVVFGFPHLRILDVSNNDFTGTLRYDYFTNLKAMYTNGDDTELKYMGNGNYYDSLVLMSKGVEMEMTRILTIYTAIDFSGNKIQGNIPQSIGLLKGLHVLNLSSNGFTGNIPSSLENLAKLESLDLSQNKLSGEIPPALANLNSLEWIDVSNNQLVGPIPQGTQFQTQKCSSYEGNPGLYGPILKDVCEDIRVPTSQQYQPSESEEEDEEWFSWIAAELGLVPGVVFGLMMGYIVTPYKHEWFIKTCDRSKHWSTRTR